MGINPIFFADFYKIGHVAQYPAGTTQVWSNWTPRKTRIEGQKDVVHFGLQYFIKKYLIEEFNKFFNTPWTAIEKEYKNFILATLPSKSVYTDHLFSLWNEGRLPVDIYSVPEGTSVPFGCPALVITNTTPDSFWLPNYLETVMSMVLWKSSTSATTAQRMRRLFEGHARKFGETDMSFVDWMGHDFSMRGMSGMEDAVLSGMGHLTAFNGTDTMPAILAAAKYYGAQYAIGGSVPATEHSVMSAGGKDTEFDTFKRLITQTYPTGPVSIVSDTWDLWKVLTEYLAQLVPDILNRDGKVIFRPDSGDPVKIICGDNESSDFNVRAGAMWLIADALGTDGKGHINKGGAIYGDSINYERADQILTKLSNKGLSPYNMVFGIGSYTYEYVTRDTHSFAMKATAIRQNGKLIPIFKDPVTDDGMKKSHKGIVAVYNASARRDFPNYVYEDQQEPEALDNCAFQKVFSNGELVIEDTFDAIRKRVRR